MKRVIEIVVLGLLLATSIHPGEADCRIDAQPMATTPTHAALTLEQILDNYVQALGGRESIEKLTSRVTVQSVAGPDGVARMEIYDKTPNKKLIVTIIEKSERIKIGFDGDVGWATTPENGVRELKGIELANLRLNSNFYREIKLKEIYPKLTLKGEEVIDGKTTYRIEALISDGRAEKMYFDAKTGLLTRRIQQSVALIRQSDDEALQETIIDIEYNYADYRSVDGVKFPFLIQRRLPAIETTIKVDEIKHNVIIDDAKFKRPGR